MILEDRIEYLVALLNKYTVEDVNQLYREKEVQFELEYFEKYPHVKWASPLKKRMIQEAKRKKISDGRKKYLAQLIEQINSYDKKNHLEMAIKDMDEMLRNLDKAKIDKTKIRLLYIEFSMYADEARIQAYGEYQTDWFDNELGAICSKFNSTHYWKELDSNKFATISELLEIINVEEEEYPGIFCEIWEKRVFQILKDACNVDKIKKKLVDDLPKTKIQVGMHDDDFFEIYGE